MVLEVESETSSIAFVIRLVIDGKEEQDHRSAISVRQVDPPPNIIGCTIVGAELSDDQLFLNLDNGNHIAIFDDMQGGSDLHRMQTDDDLTTLVGQKLTRIEAKPGLDTTQLNNTHHGYETYLLEVGTSDGSVTLLSHNEPEFGVSPEIRIVAKPFPRSFDETIHYR